MQELIAHIADRTLDPYTAVEEVLAKIGYLPIDCQGANLFFHLISHRPV